MELLSTTPNEVRSGWTPDRLHTVRRHTTQRIRAGEAVDLLPDRTFGEDPRLGRPPYRVSLHRLPRITSARAPE